MERYGERGSRTWRKLHLAVNSSTGEILASELTSNEDGDASQVSPLLGQITGTPQYGSTRRWDTAHP